VITGPRTLNPNAVAAPAGVTIVLTIVSGDHRPHRVVVRTAPARSKALTYGAIFLTVPAGGRASVPVTDLMNGRYPLEVDGARAGALIIGAQPGP
jgi:hypothetical protein